MAKGFKHGAGGTDALNFKVVGGTEQPENPKENTIWVNTGTEISGWVFSPEEPVEPSGGLVWIGLGTASPAPFNALKKGGLYCFPTSCGQYVGGAWANKDAFLFAGGEWVRFSSTIVWIYDNGVTSLSWNGKGTDIATALVMTIAYASYGGGYSSAGWKGSTKKVNVPSGASALKMTYSTSGNFSGVKNRIFGLRTAAYAGSSNSNFENSAANFAAYVSMNAGTNVTVSLPITDALAGNSYYIGLWAYTASNTDINATVTVSKIWIE